MIKGFILVYSVCSETFRGDLVRRYISLIVCGDAFSFFTSFFLCCEGQPRWGLGSDPPRRTLDRRLYTLSLSLNII